MQCPKCGCERSSVVDSRGDGQAIRRRRECQECSFRFTTYERIERQLPMVIKKDGRREQYDREKLKRGIMKACQKRPVSIEEIDRRVDLIEKDLQDLCEKEIPSRQIGDFIMSELKKIDQIAYVRFASVYREFSDVNQFVDTLKSLDDDNTSVDSPEVHKIANHDSLNK
ncbi:MAG: transcriptional repressor NrdR [Candidatus Dadabacteria bacterium]|nr:MAG: transcriptional repressor NrdR [Candidatus Dadabacteria bacterium]